MMTASNKAMLKRAESILKDNRFLNDGDSAFAEHVEIVSAELGKVEVKFEVTENLLNIRGFVHGGLLCYLVDVLTFMAAYTFYPPPHYSVSLNINANFVRGMRNGETMHATAVAIKAGKRVIFAKVHFRDADSNLRAYGGQTIYILNDGNDSQTKKPSTQLSAKSKL